MASPGKPLTQSSTQSEVEAFLRKAAAVPAPGRAGRLLFALDATASREPTWREASHIQAEMFREAGNLGGLAIQLAYYRGFAEFSASPWLTDTEALLHCMNRVRCLGGNTQIAKVLRHALAESRAQKISAVVFVGDCMEEDVDSLCRQAGELGLLGVPIFLFHEGDDTVAARAFAQMAKLSGGACCRFDAASPQQLRDLLRAVAVFAAGGRKALSDYSARHGGVATLLIGQMKRA